MKLVTSVVRWLEVQRNRRTIYSLAVIALPVLTGAAVLTDGQAQKILSVLAVLAGASVPGLARKHTLTSRPYHDPDKTTQAGAIAVGEACLIALLVVVVLWWCGVRP